MRRRDWYGSAFLAVLILLAKTVEAPILGAVAAILFVLIVIDVWRDRKRVNTATTPQSPRANLSTLDPLTPLDTPIKPPSLGDHFKDQYTKGEPDYSAIPTDPSKLQKMNPFPDFTEEWKERERLMQRCTGAVEEPEAVWAWINKVHDKIATVSRSKAMEFKPDQPAVTQTSDLMRPVVDMVNYINQGIKENQSRKNLIEYGQRLAKIEDAARNGD